LQNKKVKFINESYNKLLYFLLGGVDDTNILSGNHLAIDKDTIENASTTMTTWLLNINRAFELLIKNHKISKEDMKKFNWIDVGCGSGIASIYASLNCKFSNQLLFDFDLRNISLAKKNFDISRKSLLFNQNHLEPKIIRENAQNILISDYFKKNCIVYMFNPFDQKIMKSFIINNANFLKTNNSIIIYINDKYNDLIQELLSLNPKDIRRNDKYKISTYLVR
tara:strand:- start:2496 stop:3164 length:669 start_codon:yes stop_codon:yes gene_type:complete